MEPIRYVDQATVQILKWFDLYNLKTLPNYFGFYITLNIPEVYKNVCFEGFGTFQIL